MSGGGEQCRPLLGEDGQVLAVVHGAEPLSDEAAVHMRNLVDAARRLAEADPDRAEKQARQAASRERIRERNRRIFGEREAK